MINRSSFSESLVTDEEIFFVCERSVPNKGIFFSKRSKGTDDLKSSSSVIVCLPMKRFSSPQGPKERYVVAGMICENNLTFLLLLLLQLKKVKE